MALYAKSDGQDKTPVIFPFKITRVQHESLPENIKIKSSFPFFRQHLKKGYDLFYCFTKELSYRVTKNDDYSFEPLTSCVLNRRVVVQSL